MRRSLDLLVSGVALVVLSPVMILVALAIRLQMGSPVVFRQTRAGKNGVPFELLKFRTMRSAQSHERGPEFDMDRVTDLGRLLRRSSIDELPSLVNVFRGEMSLIGPRPLPVEYVDRYSAREARRLEVRPGLTGWAVVHGRNLVGWQERLELDVWYVDHRSLAVDLRILLRSVGLVLGGSGVNHDASTTMPEFRGSAVPALAVDSSGGLRREETGPRD